MREIVKRLLENHSTDINDDVVVEENEELENELVEEESVEDEELEESVEEETPDTAEEELDESDAATVSKSAQRVLNTYENLINTMKGMQKGSGYLASSKDLTPEDYKKREFTNQTILKKLDDIKDVLESIRGLVNRSK